MTSVSSADVDISHSGDVRGGVTGTVVVMVVLLLLLLVLLLLLL